MPYTVTWLPSAINELARIWNQAPDRQAVADASNAIDQLFKKSAYNRGPGLWNIPAAQG
jgi:hypothetical protein